MVDERHALVPGHKPGDITIRRRITRRRLRRVLGVPALFSSAYGNVGSSIYYALGITAAFALGLTPAVLMVAGGLFALTAISYAEGTSAFPEAGGSSSFARHAFNELISFIAGWALMLDYIITIAISSFGVPAYLSVFIPALKTWPINSICGVLVVFFLMVVNVIGVKEAARINIILAILDLATQAIIAGVGMLFVFNIETLLGNVHWGIAPTMGQLVYGLSIAMIAYTGIETVSNMAEEVRHPGQVVPRAIILVLLAVLGLYSLISTIALSALPVRQVDGVWNTELATTWLLDPVLGIVQSFPFAKEFFSVWVGLLAASILLIASNAGLLGISRLTYSMGQHRQLPPLLSAIHPRFRTPYSAIIVFSIIAAVLIVPGSLDLMVELYSFGAMLAFTFAHISIVALRWNRPDLPRPFKAPLSLHIKGRELALTALIGGLGTFTVWLIVVSTHPLGRAVGLAWMAIGLAVYFLYRRAAHLPLLETVKAEPPGVAR